MKELKEIIKAYELASKQGKQSALATVVHLEGSAYRRPGARMLVTEDGKITGAISGGCLEGDALRKAQLVMLQKKPLLVTYDTMDEDDAKLGVGLGCNGIISILIEPLNVEDENNPIQLLKDLLSNRESAVLVTLFSLNKKAKQPGTCLLAKKSGDIIKSLIKQELPVNLLNDINEVFRKESSVTKMYEAEEKLTAFLEFKTPPVSLVVVGAGNDSIPLMEIATVLGWETTIVDGRSNYATRERFITAHNVIVTKADALFSNIALDATTVIVLMTHNYNYDIAVLKQLIQLQVSYIGALGPKKKLERMLEEIEDEGIEVEEEFLSNIYGPAGLDIGAETAEEIALSIISEIKAVLSKRPGSMLRQKADTIHPREIQKILNA